MRSTGERASEKKPEEKRAGRGRRTILIVCAAILALAGLLHIISARRRAAQEFARFHISSNYLEEGGGASYTVADWGGGFDILLYNYEKEDIDQLAGVDMAYTVTAEHAAAGVKTQSGEAVAADADGAYLFAAEAAPAYHILHVTPEAGAADAITVTVQTTAPYQKTLTAKFQVRGYSKPDYTITDQNDGTVLLTVHTNDYQDTVTVLWEPEKFSPDTTNELMAAWTDETHIGCFPVSGNSTYELLFYKKTDDPYTGQTGTATEIALD